MNAPKELIKTNPYSVYKGVAAEDIEDKSVVLKVICPELMPGTSYGALGAGITEASVKLQTRDGKPIADKITTANHLVATWEGQSNVRYPPMIRKGEPVEVYKSADKDKFEWRATGKGREFRKTDRMVVEVGASDPNKPSTEKDDENTYTAYIDSHEKKVGFKTSKANGEAAAFSMEADLAKGTFHVSDNGEDPGNRLFMDTGVTSGVPVFQINLSTGITLKMEGEHLFLKVPGKMTVDVGDRFVLNSVITIFNLSQKGTIIFNAANIAFNSAKDVILTAGNVIGLSAKSTKVGGVLLAAALKATKAVKASVSGVYKPSTVQRPIETPVVDGSNSADTDMTGPEFRAP